MNLSDHTRKELVFMYLHERYGEWVDGPELANEEVGGSEGLKRLRELRSEGHHIETRKHPDPARDVWQYRLIDAPPVVSPLRVEQPIKESEYRFMEKPKKLEFGAVLPCPRCQGVRSKNCTRCNGFGVVPA